MEEKKKLGNWVVIVVINYESLLKSLVCRLAN